MSERFSATIEDYLGVLYVLERDGEPIVGVRLADLLGVKPPTVTNTLKRMVRDGLVTLDIAHSPHLTEQGKEAARSLVRRHMLAEWLLNRMLSWSKLHKEAHELEHAMSDEVAEALLEDLDSPEVCPHGNPLPGYEDFVSGWIPLTQAPTAQPLIVRRVHELAEDAPQVLSFLEEKGIEPSREVWVEDILDFNQTISLRVGKELVSLGFAVAQYIYVEQPHKNSSANIA